MLGLAFFALPSDAPFHLAQHLVPSLNVQTALAPIFRLRFFLIRENAGPPFHPFFLAQPSRRALFPDTLPPSSTKKI
jgi:hypothetical protein